MITRKEKDERIQTLIIDKKVHIKSKVTASGKDVFEVDKKIVEINNEIKKTRDEYKQSIANRKEKTNEKNKRR